MKIISNKIIIIYYNLLIYLLFYYSNKSLQELWLSQLSFLSCLFLCRIESWFRFVIQSFIINTDSWFVLATNIISSFHIVNNHVSIQEHVTEEPSAENIKVSSWIVNEDWNIALSFFCSPLSSGVNQVFLEWESDLIIMSSVCADSKVDLSILDINLIARLFEMTFFLIAIYTS